MAIVQALESLGYQELSLKWPNDILWRQQKLCGILLEIAGDIDDGFFVVVGIGINVSSSRLSEVSIDQPWVDLLTIGDGEAPNKNQIAGCILQSVLTLLADFEQRGFMAYRDAWLARDAMVDREIQASR